MSNVKFEKESKYFSGQGVVLLGLLSSAGAFIGFEQAGNCSSAVLQISTSVQEKRGSQDGQRAIEKRINTETNAKFMADMDSWHNANIARALRGHYTRVPAGTVASEAVFALPGTVFPLRRMKVSSVVISGMTEYTTPGTAWDFKVNADHGSLMFNDGSVELPATIGEVPTLCTEGTDTVITAPGTYAVGDRVFLYGFTGTGVGAVLNKLHTVKAIGSGTFTVEADTSTLTATLTTAKVLNLDRGLITDTVAYSYDEQVDIEALTRPLTEIMVRVEGLNTAETNEPVVIDIWKVSTDPLKEMALINDAYGSFQLEGSVLADNTRPSGESKYWRVKTING